MCNGTIELWTPYTTVLDHCFQNACHTDLVIFQVMEHMVGQSLTMFIVQTNENALSDDSRDFGSSGLSIKSFGQNK